MPSERKTVHVTVELPPLKPKAPAATLRVQLEEVTRADAPANLIDRAERPAKANDDGVINVELSAAKIDSRVRYVVRAMLTDAGDRLTHVTTESYPVLTFSHPDTLTITLRPV